MNPDYADQSLLHLSKLGASGKYPQNARRDLLNFVGEPSSPKLFRSAVHVKVQKPRRSRDGEIHAIISINMAFFLPHEYFHYLYTKKRSLFNRIMLGGDPGRVEEFWKGVQERNDPRFHQLMLTDMDRDTEWLKKCVPLSFHGDEVPVIAVGKAGTKSLDVSSQQSVLARNSSSLVVKQPLCAVFGHNKVHTEECNTEQEIGEVLGWSYRALQAGKWPSNDHRGKAYDPLSAEGQLAGTDLADGWCAAIYLMKSDLDFLAKSLGLRHYSANEFCDLCPCNVAGEPGLWPSNFGPDSRWIHALFSVEEWRALYPNVPHWLFLLVHVSQHNVEPDELHIIWMGTAAWCNGSVLWMLVFRVMPKSAVENMQDLWAQITQCYSEFGTSSQYTNLTIGSFCDPAKPSGHYPKLKGRGAEVKGLSAVLCRVWEQNMNTDNPEHRLVFDLLENQRCMERVIDDHAHELFLGPGQALQFQTHIITFLHKYTQLGHLADARGDLLWNVTPKFHYLYHLGQRSHYLSPRRGACWVDEDYVGKCKVVAARCSAGTQLHCIPGKMLENMRHGLELLHDQLERDLV